jgi:hypothetical protein
MKNKTITVVSKGRNLGARSADSPVRRDAPVRYTQTRSILSCLRNPSRYASLIRIALQNRLAANSIFRFNASRSLLIVEIGA